MEKINMSLRDEHFEPILSRDNISATKIIKFTFSNYDRTVNEIIQMFHKFGSLDEILMYDIYYVCQTLGYFLEESHDLKLNPYYKLKMKAVKEFLTDDIPFGILLYVDLFQTDEDLDVSGMYPTSGLYWTNARGGGRVQLNKFLNKLSFDFNKEEEGGENMIRLLPNPKRVICSGPVTTVIYGDGSKTHVRKTEDDENDYEKAFLLSWLYKTYGKSVVEKKLKEFKSEFVEPEEPAYMGAVAEALNHVLKMSIGKKK